MSNSLGAMHAEVAQARADQAEALALQQQMLAREEFQSRLEEFVYQAEKLVAECRRPDTDLPPSTRYYLLDGVIRQVEQDGIGTAVIRGRDNKAAFDRVLGEVRQLRSALMADPEVKAALAWAAKVDEQRAEQRRQIERKMRPYRQQLDALRAGRNSATMRQVAESWLKKGRARIPQPYWGALLAVAALQHVFLFPVMVPMTLLGLWLGREYLDRELNAGIDAEIGAVEQRLRALQDKLNVI